MMCVDTVWHFLSHVRLINEAYFYPHFSLNISTALLCFTLVVDDKSGAVMCKRSKNR